MRQEQYYICDAVFVDNCGPCSTSEPCEFDFAQAGRRGGAANVFEGLKHTITGQTTKTTPKRRHKPAAAFAEEDEDLLERGLRIVKIKGDGRCLFRALAKGMTHNQGSYISGDKEEEAADELRLAVHDALCRDQARAATFQEVDFSIENFDGGKAKYCARLNRSDFWGGDVEMLVLSKMLRVPIYVYRTAEDAGLIAEYGRQWERQGGKAGMGQPVKVLFGNGNHYDVLL